MDKILRVMIISLMVMVGVYNADASEVKRVDIGVKVNSDGSAHIIEDWNCVIDSGDEMVRDIIQLNGSKISNLSVSNEVGLEYTYTQTWDSNKTRLDKYKLCGIQERMNGDISIYWGVGDYGDRAYRVEYDIDKFVRVCKDAQFIYYTYVTPGINLYPEKVVIDIEFPEGVYIGDIYNYGFVGGYKIDGNRVRVESEDYKFGEGSYIVSLMGVKGFKGIEISSNKVFRDIVREADEGQGLGVVTKPITIKGIMVYIIIGVVVVGIMLEVIRTIRLKERLRNEKGLPVKYIGEVEIKGIDEVSSVDLGLERIYSIYNIGIHYGIIQNKYSILGALLLKWVIEGRLKLDKELVEIEFSREVEGIEDSNELELYKMFIGIQEEGDCIIDMVQLDRWFKENNKRYKDWVNGIISSESRVLQDKGVLRSVAVSGRVQRLIKFKEYKVSELMSKEVERVLGYKRYIKEYSGEIDKRILVMSALYNITNIYISRSSLIDNDKMMGLNKLVSMISVRVETSR